MDNQSAIELIDVLSKLGYIERMDNLNPLKVRIVRDEWERNMLKDKNKKLRFVVITLLGVIALLNFYSGIDLLFNLLKITSFENYFYVGCI